MSSLLDRASIKSDIVVYKGVRLSSLLEKVKALNPGDKLSFDSFTSTTLNFKYACSFADTGTKNQRIVLRFHIKKGSSGAFISFDGAEQELLLNKGYEFTLSKTFTVDMDKNEYDVGKVLVYDFKTR